MSLIQEKLDARHLPAADLTDREGLLKLLEREEYGKRPVERRVTAEIMKNERAFANKCDKTEWRLTVSTEKGETSFPVTLLMPDGDKVPVFVFLAFDKEIPNKYFPAEEIIDRGFGAAMIWYKDVVNDNTHGDFSDGMGKWYSSGRADDDMGKIGMWALAASSVADVLLRDERVDPARLAVIGHSRLGKTALWCGANDERFQYVIVNDSGAGGAALYRGKTGETISDFTSPDGNGFWDWFVGDFRKWYGRDGEEGFDQHMLLACVAPRRLLIGGAIEDSWADPASEYLACCAASEAWTRQGHKGFVAPDRLPEVGDNFSEGDIAFHLRKGSHFLSRTDWNIYMDTIEGK